MHVAILTDYPVVRFANGPSLATQALNRYLTERGHQVTLVGPQPGPGAPPVVDGSVMLRSARFRAHPGVELPFPWPRQAFADRGFDVVHSQANSSLMHWGPMIRRLHGVPVLATNTVYIPGFAQYALPSALYRFAWARRFWERVPARAVEMSFARVYNAGDGLIVQCSGLAEAWEALGVDVPIHVIPRPIDTVIFDHPVGPDPFQRTFEAGKRILVVCRHAREKSLDKVLRAFAGHVLPRHPQASLTLVGDGQEHQSLIELAEDLRISERCDFPGEKAQRDLRDYYGHADLFAYASTTETYGQVVSEALWCGVPVVAIDDAMGVAFQVRDGHDGRLVRPGTDDIQRLGEALAHLLAEPRERHVLSAQAAVRARQRVAPSVIYRLYESAYDSAIEHFRRRPAPAFDRSSAAHWWSLHWRHGLPWTFQQALLLGLGALRMQRETYVMPQQRIDVLPELAADRREAA